jgi:hypothetical protein
VLIPILMKFALNFLFWTYFLDNSSVINKMLFINPLKISLNRATSLD